LSLSRQMLNSMVQIMAQVPCFFEQERMLNITNIGVRIPALRCETATRTGFG
jgi:hypothetical protein